jgi:hypothetical protein
VRTAEIDSPMDEDNYKLVQALGDLKTDKPVIDERFNILKPDTVKIKRSVEVLQWVERSENSEEHGKRYFYEKEWLEHIVDQNTFREFKKEGASNPVSWPCSS